MTITTYRCLASTGRPTGAVRISFGYMSTVEDAMEFLFVVDKYFVSKSPTIISSPLEPLVPVVSTLRIDGDSLSPLI